MQAVDFYHNRLLVIYQTFDINVHTLLTRGTGQYIEMNVYIAFNLQL